MLLRYLADASYWIYLVHSWFCLRSSTALMDLDWPWGSKFATAVLATLGIRLLSYHGLVRATVLRKVLGQARPDTSPSPGAV